MRMEKEKKASQLQNKTFTSSASFTKLHFKAFYVVVFFFLK